LSGLSLELSRSPRLAAAIVGLHAAAAASVVAVIPGVAGNLLAAALLALGAAAAWSRALLGSGGSVRAIELTGPAIALKLASGERFVAELAPRRYVTRFVVALPVRRPARRTILVTRDMLAPDSFRVLRLWALWGKIPGVAGKQLAA
jgi:hypothetical protein